MRKACPLRQLGETISCAIKHENFEPADALCTGRYCAWFSEEEKKCAMMLKPEGKRDEPRYPLPPLGGGGLA